MGALTDWDDFLATRAAPYNRIRWAKGNPANNAGRVQSGWAGQPYDVGSAPTTAAAPTKATTGALPDWQNGGSDTLRCLGATARFSGNSGSMVPGVAVLCDRLSHQGGLSGTTTTAQTTNLPTSALTRYTNGVGVMMGLEIYTQIGATGTTVTCSYTNEGGTAGRTSTAVAFGATGFREAGRMILPGVAAGDLGVKSVESVTVLATTGTAGAFGVTLFKPLQAFVFDGHEDIDFDPVIGGRMFGGMPEIVDDACLFWLLMITTGAGAYGVGTLFLAET
jgi:hypothetical protein